MSKTSAVILHNNIEVEIQNENFQRIGEAPSLAKAARKCFIKDVGSIWDYLYKMPPKKESSNRKNGIKSKATGKRYHFKLK